MPQLQREAAVVLALGGGFQAYFTQRRDASIDLAKMPLMREVAAFARARQHLCHGTETVPQVGLLYSTAAYYRKSPRLFSPGGVEEAPLGILQNLLDCQHAVDLVSEHHLTGRLNAWPLIVVPEWEYLEEGFRAELVDYARNGGKLLLIGPATASLFKDVLGAEMQENASAPGVHFLQVRDSIAGVNSSVLKITPQEGTLVRGRILARDDRDAPGTPAATVHSVGKGTIAAVWLTLGRAYRTDRSTGARDFLNSLVRELLPHPIVAVTGSHLVEVIVRRSGDQLRVNLVNTAGPHEDQRQPVFDEIPVVGPLTLSIRMPTWPREISIQPSGVKPHVEFRDGVATVQVPRVAIHEVVVVSL